MTPSGGAIAADEQTMAALGEFGLIAALSGWLPPDSRTLVGIGDDAAVLAAPDGRVVASTDFLLEGRHFRRDWSSGTDVGRKAAARSLIDVAAMGASDDCVEQRYSLAHPHAARTAQSDRNEIGLGPGLHYADPGESGNTRAVDRGHVEQCRRIGRRCPVPEG